MVSTPITGRRAGGDRLAKGINAAVGGGSFSQVHACAMRARTAYSCSSR